MGQAPLLSAAEIFTLFFVTLGPLKVLGPFAQRTRGREDLTELSFWAFSIATISAVAGGFLGTVLLAKWEISMAALMLAAGIIFFLVALKQLMAQYERAMPLSDAPLPEPALAAAAQLVFPVVLTPYGIAAVIALLARSNGGERTTTIIAILIGVLVLDLLAMLFARRILVGIVPLVLQVVGAVLAVLQVAFSIQFILGGLKALQVIAA